MPGDLDQDGEFEWRRLCAACVSLGVLTVADRSIVELAAHAYATFIRATRVLMASGNTYETKNRAGEKVIKARPEAAIASDAWRRYRAAICELGLTPAARTRVEAASDNTDGGTEGYFN